MDGNAENAKEIAERVVAERFPDASLAFCAGSVVRGEATSSSDIDLVVLFPRLQRARRESFLFEGWPVEAFVHDPETLGYFFHEIDAASGMPSLPQMVAEGLLVKGCAQEARSLQASALRLIEKGPAPLDRESVRDRIYGITDLLDDLKAPRSRAEALGTATRLYSALGDFLLRAERCWSGSGKQLPRALLRQLPSRHERFHEAFEAFFARGDSGPLLHFASSVLQEKGGAVFDGYRREAPPDWRRASPPEGQLRLAVAGDLPALLAVEGDPDENRRSFLAARVKEASVLLVEAEGTAIGHAVFDTGFFQRPFIHLVVVDPRFRRKGIGKKLVAAIERRFPGTRIFTSTNESNRPARQFFQGLGFQPCGSVDQLDEGDPELFFCKQPGDGARK